MKINEQIFNEIQEVSPKWFELNYGCKPEDADEAFYDLALRLAKNELDLEPDYDDPDFDEDEYNEIVYETALNIISVKAVSRDGFLWQALRYYFNAYYDADVADHIRSAELEQDWLFYVAGCNYNTIDSDLLGGSADGRAIDAFLKKINEVK